MAAPLQEATWSSIPDDIAHKFASLLEAADVCSLGRCSRFWHRICVSDCLWMEFARRRWPMLILDSDLRESLQIPRAMRRIDEVVAHEDWRRAYIYLHQSLASSVSIVKQFVEQSTQNESLEVGYYLKAVSTLHSYQLSFKDVEVFLFSKSCSALLNLIGLHYCLLRLEIPAREVLEALHRSQVSEREICISWFKLGRWFYGFRLHDENRTRKISLGKIVMGEGDEVLGVLNRGAVHEVIRVHIAPTNPRAATSSSCNV